MLDDDRASSGSKRVRVGAESRSLTTVCHRVALPTAALEQMRPAPAHAVALGGALRVTVLDLLGAADAARGADGGGAGGLAGEALQLPSRGFVREAQTRVRFEVGAGAGGAAVPAALASVRGIEVSARAHGFAAAVASEDPARAALVHAALVQRYASAAGAGADEGVSAAAGAEARRWLAEVAGALVADRAAAELAEVVARAWTAARRLDVRWVLARA